MASVYNKVIKKCITKCICHVSFLLWGVSGATVILVKHRDILAQRCNNFVCKKYGLSKDFCIPSAENTAHTYTL